MLFANRNRYHPEAGLGTLGTMIIGAIVVGGVLGLSKAHDADAEHKDKDANLAASDVTVHTHRSIKAFEKIFGCTVQHDLHFSTNSQEYLDITQKQKACIQKIADTIGNNTYGWGPDQEDDLQELWNSESGWSAEAENPSSAIGIPQMLDNKYNNHSLIVQEFGTGKWSYYKNPVSQVEKGLEYIHDRYGDPASALVFHHENNWY